MKENCVINSGLVMNEITLSDQLVERIATLVANRVIEACSKKEVDLTFEYKFNMSGVNLNGMRLVQFKRFCQIMHQEPQMLPYHAAMRALADIKGEGGYKLASSLQRYASAHSEHWKCSENDEVK